MRTGCVSLHEVTNFIYEMSRVEICSLAYEGKFNDLKEKIGLKPSLATQIDEVSFLGVTSVVLPVDEISIIGKAHSLISVAGSSKNSTTTPVKRH